MDLNSKSPHILNASANLLGFCLIVLTSLKISDYRDSSMIDELTGISSLLLMMSTVLSFLSLRAERPGPSRIYENFADFIFLMSLVCLLIVVLIITFLEVSEK